MTKNKELKKDKWVWGNRHDKWYLVDETDKDYNSGIPDDMFQSEPDKDKLKQIYLSPNIFFGKLF